MAELEIDQSNLPRVQEVCQCFAVLEDGVLAHNLQEQEIEQYYTTNIQKNQLVQNDIRVAKRLQNEEEEQRAQQSATLRQTSRQLEEQDFEYARIIQEEIVRCDEEARRREHDDEEIAKQMQEEEEQRIRRWSRGQEGCSEGSAGDPALPPPHQHTLSSLHQEGEQYSPTTTRWQYSTSRNHSDLTGPWAVSPRGLAAQENTTSWSNQGHTASIRQIRSELREPLSEGSEDSDTVFSEPLSVRSQRLNERLNTAPPQWWTSLHHPQERNYRSVCSHSSFTDELGVQEERGEWDGDYYGDREKRRPRSQDQERNLREEYEGWHRSRDQSRDCRLVEVRERRCSRSKSVRLHDRNRHGNRDSARTWSCKENPDKRVHFQDDTRSSNRQQDESSYVWEMLGQVLRERGVPVRFGGSGAPLQIRPQSRDSQVLHGSEVSYCDSQPDQRVFQRAATTRHSFHGDIRERRRSSYRESSGRDHREDRERHRDNVKLAGEIYRISGRDSYLDNRERQGSRRWREHGYTNDHEREGNYRVKRTTSECRRWHKTIEERLSSEEEQEAERRVEWPPRRVHQHSQSLSTSGASTRDRSRHMAAGVPLQPEPAEASLDLGELQQVLQDEELARKLQDEEEKLLRRNSQPSPRSSYPGGDFRVAQVAQDEEIARFMQKQEITSKRRSRELEGPASWREHKAMISHHERRAVRERQVQRERLDSEGLPSPTEDCSSENQPPSPISTSPQAQQIRNIAEELDPTFQARRQDPESLRVGQTALACPSLPMPHCGSHDFLEEPTFVPPTKRQNEKSGRTKPKEKKENCKQQ
ncbi:coiled-coil domain-containing protein 187 isoform X1 [Xiphias gladius]|uniref:coiled-coil domain-containing protein 187 isoform X1 n=1 Tax=Xiphias gladius TaxID=8245 RepID=UPI001A98B777|nr:coiled-coil domain-containing protein 187 isoform X1 [Xiphias gladius]XP_040008481.1 coiled-coil domain-containing protein 187 isoform X1 [Xiphias gladius]XP_040008482.1 coiled-coil domain-containing protein 187 isoform X1 [Xiphias gladius]XP_040008483.1 coiled-coil domain-containing protein 187 isoform X1 [Xiphias gladius]XP_040008484.1 coiled-coil domain-containing protein 187 isoform X1 [Xiphias gladius]XP_040008485.1 coiled-coil domain-containing protein 187 isoform X1 [Xiphias gladius]